MTIRKILTLIAVLMITLPTFGRKNFAARGNDFDWGPLIEAISKVESSQNPKAYNKNGNCAGYLQITPVVIKDVNQVLKKSKSGKRYTLQDRFNKQKSIEMFVIYQRTHNPSNSIEKAIRIWNGGPNYSVSKTNGYYRKVMNKFRP